MAQGCWGARRSHPGTWRLLFGDDTTGDPHVASIHAAIQARANRAVAERVLYGVDARTSDDRLRLEMVGEILGGATRSLIRWWHGHDDVPKEVLVDTLMAVVWSGMAATVPALPEDEAR